MSSDVKKFYEFHVKAKIESVVKLQRPIIITRDEKILFLTWSLSNLLDEFRCGDCNDKTISSYKLRQRGFCLVTSAINTLYRT